MGPVPPPELQSQCLRAPLSLPCQVWAPPSVDAQKCLLNEPLGALHPSPHPEPFFRVAAKNEDRGQKGMSYLSKIYVTLPGVTITLLKGRETLVSLHFSSVPPAPPGLAVACPHGLPCPSQRLQPPTFSGTASTASHLLPRITVGRCRAFQLGCRNLQGSPLDPPPSHLCLDLLP